MKKQLVLGGALGLVVIDALWLLTCPPHSTRPDPGAAVTQQGAFRNEAAGTTGFRQADSVGRGVVATLESASVPLMADFSAPVDPVLAATVTEAVAALKALYEPAGSLGWDEAKALLARREQATMDWVERLGRLGQGGARAMAAVFSQSDSIRAKLLLIQGLGKVDDPEAAAVLQTLLEADPSFSMRKAVVVALGQRRDRGAEQILAGVLALPSDAQLRFAAAQALAGRESTLPVLTERLRIEPSPDVRMEMMRSVGLIQNPAAMQVLAELAQSRGEPLERKTAIQELARSFGPSALPVLGRLLNDSDEAIRSSAVAALARVRTDDAVTLLQRTADTDPSVMVSGAATAALASR